MGITARTARPVKKINARVLMYGKYNSPRGLVDLDAQPRKVFSWKAQDRPELPAAFKNKFKTTDECKPVAGNRILITASSDGVATPVAVPTAPVPFEEVDSRPFQMRLDLLNEQRLIIQSQLDWTNQQIEKAYSFFDKGPNYYPLPGYRSKTVGVLQYFEMQLAVVDARIANVEDEARSAGAILDNR